MGNVLSDIFVVLAALVLPIAAGIGIAVKRKTGKAILLGTACFLIFQVFTRIPILQYALPQWAGFIIFQNSRPVLYMGLLAISAGLFEEIGRFIIMRLFMKNSRYIDSVAFGIGHGGIEAVLLVGINALVLLLTFGGGSVPQAEMFLSGAERLLAMLAHLGWSVMVWRGVTLKKWNLIALAVLSHALFDFIPVYMSFIGINVYSIESVIGVFSLFLMWYAVFIGKKTGIEGGVEQ